MRWAWLALAAACSGQSGTLHVSLTTAPGSHILDGAQELKLVLTNPHTVTTAERGPNGFSLAFDVPADGAIGALIVDAFDGNGALIATGASPPFASGGIEAKVVIYMAAPNSLGAAPVALPAARGGIAATALGYGALFAGGADSTGPTDVLGIYNAFDHSLIAGKPLPAPRRDLIAATGANGIVYLFGGNDATGALTDNLWRFDTTVAPGGAYTDYGDQPGFARAGERALPIGGDSFLVTGTPALVLEGFEGALSEQAGISSLPRAGAAVTASDGVTTVIFAGPTGIVRYRDGTFDTITGTPPLGADVAAVPGGRVVIACGGADATVVDAGPGLTTALPGVPGVAKTGCAIAATPRHLVIAGGTLAGGGVDPMVQIYDASTLALVTTATLTVPRTGAIALPLPNDQILIAGGLDMSGAPIATLELFTPEPLE